MRTSLFSRHWVNTARVQIRLHWAWHWICFLRLSEFVCAALVSGIITSSVYHPLISHPQLFDGNIPTTCTFTQLSRQASALTPKQCCGENCGACHERTQGLTSKHERAVEIDEFRSRQASPPRTKNCMQARTPVEGWFANEHDEKILASRTNKTKWRTSTNEKKNFAASPRSTNGHKRTPVFSLVREHYSRTIKL